jgi:hypothetical protein
MRGTDCSYMSEGPGGEVELTRGLRHEISLKMKREEKGRRVDGKSSGGLQLGLADGGRADAIPNAAGGEGSHGAARPEGVIHRYNSNLVSQVAEVFTDFGQD